MESKIITRKTAELCLWYIKKHISEKAILVGSFSKGAETSNKDIDIYIPPPHRELNDRDKRKFLLLLDAKSMEVTDWDGWFFHDTPFGNVDIFFDISKFDY